MSIGGKARRTSSHGVYVLWCKSLDPACPSRWQAIERDYNSLTDAFDEAQDRTAASRHYGTDLAYFAGAPNMAAPSEEIFA